MPSSLWRRQHWKARTKGDAEVAKGTAGDGHVDGELGVAEGGEEGTESDNGN